MQKKADQKNNLYYLKHEWLGRYSVSFFGVFLVLLTICLVFFLTVKGLALFYQSHGSFIEFLFSKDWNPERDPIDGAPQIGAQIFVVGSVLVSLLALVISTPFSLSVSIFISEISPKFGRKILQPVMEVFVGIPSVVYGWIGLSLLVPFIRKQYGGLGFSWLAGSIVLSIMIFPTIVSVATDALTAIPKDYREASLALGATRWQTIIKVILPAAVPGILTGIVLGLARAFGEALAVQMVLGNRIRIPTKLTDATVNLTSIITMDMGGTAQGSLANNALWTMAFLLLIMSFLFILTINLIGRKGKRTS